jgi:hypothetical protein
MPENDSTAASRITFGNLCFKALFAGAIIGALQGLVGYIPRVDAFLIALEASVVGAVVATLLAAFLYQVAFRDFDILPIFRSIVWISGICGVLAALAFRWFTHGEGATLSAFVTPTVAVICAAAIRTYLGFAKRRVREPAAKS